MSLTSLPLALSRSGPAQIGCSLVPAPFCMLCLRDLQLRWPDACGGHPGLDEDTVMGKVTLRVPSRPSSPRRAGC